ncbi:MAG: phosphoenolpyruvate hydrolase family protein [Ectothiorhodospiraceae bacterium]|nr:phosphoenolpyruvate hydrolase family protein [Ectothiorhodospiraceae bacterium]
MTHDVPRTGIGWDREDGWFVASLAEAGQRSRGPCILSPLTAAMNPRLADMACAMPVGDANGTLLAALPGIDKTPWVIAGVLANDPFRRSEDLLDALCKAGAGAICNWPSVGLLTGELAAALIHSGFTYASELTMLKQARERGLATVTVVSNAEQLDAALEQATDMLLVVPGLAGGTAEDRERRAEETAALLHDASARAAGVERWLYLHPVYGSTLLAVAAQAQGVIRHPLTASTQPRP